jgi:hypothetical protein
MAAIDAERWLEHTPRDVETEQAAGSGLQASGQTQA